MASAEHSPASPRLEELGPIATNENTPLTAAPDNQRTYTGLAKYIPALDPNARKLVFMAGLKVLALFIVGSVVLGGTLWVALPTLEEADRPMLRIPKSFIQLQDLNTLLKKYRDVYPYRIFSGLDQMTSAEDFHLISWKNFGLLAAVVVAVLIPVGLRWSWKRELEDVGQDEVRLAGGPAVAPGKAKSQPVLLASEDEDEGEYVSEERARQEAARMNLDAFYNAPTRWWKERRDRKRQRAEREENELLAALAGE
ncbi:hypothetical protein FRC06_002077 [Ceratobasidium sp. 370]|nr:hypothetical protein FRC06_002077 [Ceratobasidium sp. 370]